MEVIDVSINNRSLLTNGSMLINWELISMTNIKSIKQYSKLILIWLPGMH